MPAYEATPEELQQYGASLSIWEQLRLLSAWSPLIAYGQRFVQTADPYQRAIIVAEACEWLAARTDAKVDDELVQRLAAVLKTKEGEQLVRWLLLQVEGAK